MPLFTLTIPLALIEHCYCVCQARLGWADTIDTMAWQMNCRDAVLVALGIGDSRMCSADSFLMPGQPTHLFYVVLWRSGVSLVRVPATVAGGSCEYKSNTLTLQGVSL